jgi:hypothetical protein
MKILLLHLSDIHLKTRTDPVLSQIDAIARTANSRIRSAEAVYVVVSGDISYSGSKEQYEIASGFFRGLCTALKKDADTPVYLILSPGNHDCDFSDDQSIRDALLANVLQNNGREIAPAIIAELVKVQQWFFKLRNDLEPKQKILDDPLWVTYQFNIGGYAVVFDCLNVAWMSKRRDEPGKMLFPYERFEHMRSDPPQIRVAVLHHPLNWHNQASYRPFRKFIHSIAEIILTGHEHEQNVGENVDAESAQSTYVEGGVLQSHNGKGIPSFNLLELDMDEQKYACELYEWKGTQFTPRVTAGWQDYRPLPKKPRNELLLSDEFGKRLEDPGAAFSHPGKQVITLSDIYVFPDLLLYGRYDPHVKGTVSSGSLRDVKLLKNGVLIKGDEKTGKTSLLYQLFRYFHDNGYAPLFLRGPSLKSNERDLKKAIEQAVTYQYGHDAVVRFHQTPLPGKIALVDDFDGQKLTNLRRAEILKLLQDQFGGVLLTVSDLFEMEEVIAEGSIQSLVGFKQYALLEFGHKLRFDLIRKWSSLGQDSGRDSNDIFNSLDQMEKAINSIIGKNLVPRVPLYLLTLLQSLELGRAAELQNSAYGDCYRFLITGALARAGVKPVEVTEYLQYCTLLSWEYCKCETKELDAAKLAEFNEWFSKEYYRRDFHKRVTLLAECKILDLRGEYYSFRYPYIYYFFLGKYLSDNLQDAAIRERVERYCRHLYVQEYANSILFLAHHSRDSFVYEQIIEVLHGLFAEKPGIEFDGDTQSLASLVESAPKLVFMGGDAIQNRREARELQDEAANADSEDAEPNSEEESLSLISKLTLLFKTVEILGQILKNQYATIPNQEKERLLLEAFDGPLRALRDFFDLIAADQDTLVNEIECVIAESDSPLSEEKRKKVSRNVVFYLIVEIAFGAICKTALSVGSEHLREAISRVAETKDTNAYRLIDLAVKLEAQSGIPYCLIRELKERTNSDMFARQLLQRLVLNYLYMFKTRDAEKQKLCTELGISMRTQRAIDIRSKDNKRD